eukprot:gene22910-biopygen10298
MDHPCSTARSTALHGALPPTRLASTPARASGPVEHGGGVLVIHVSWTDYGDKHRDNPGESCPPPPCWETCHFARDQLGVPCQCPAAPAQVPRTSPALPSMSRRPA